ncbi:MAG: hypothetical protein KatS3mg031_0910 [Chitinophagales bacterium]|nr:MAG: hypothetical protein KatS3mg031_0910 [Chitinophagales bacterium]
MFKRNTVFFGILQGFLFPVLFFFILQEINQILIRYYFGRPPGLSLKFLSILSIASNLIPLLIANQSRNTRAMRGVMTATLLLTAAVIAYFWREFLTGG